MGEWYPSGLISYILKIQAQNIAMLRLLPDYPQYELPYGVKSVVKKKVQ